MAAEQGRVAAPEAGIPANSPTRRYKAFISYSHAADCRFAPSLQHALERFTKPLFQRRAIEVFRDDTNLSLSPHLWPDIERALSDSEFFILLASPQAAQSEWVGREVDYWLKYRSLETLLLVLTAGEVAWDAAHNDFDWTKTAAIPEALKGQYRFEPLYCDFRWAQTTELRSLSNEDYQDAVGTIAATLYGVEKSVIVGRALAEQRKVVRLAIGVSVTLAVLLASALFAGWRAVRNGNRTLESIGQVWLQQLEAVASRQAAEHRQDLAEAAGRTAVRQWKEAERQRGIAVEQRNTAIAGQLAVQSELARRESPNLLERAVLLGVHSSRLHPTLAGGMALQQALALLPPTVAALPDETRFRIVALSPDGRYAATGGDDRRVTIWELAGGKPVWQADRPGGVRALAVDPGGKYVAVGGADGAVEVLDIANGKRISQVTHQGAVQVISFSPDGKLAASGGRDRTARVFEVATGREVSRVTHGGPVLSLDFSPAGELIATGSQDGTARVSSTATGVEVSHVNHETSVVSVKFRPDGQLVASRSLLLYLWDPKNPQGVWRAPPGESGANIAFSSDWRHLGILSLTRNIVRVVDAVSHEEVWRAVREGDSTTSRAAVPITFSPDGRFLAAVNADLCVRIFEADSGIELLRAPQADHVEFLGFTSDSRRLVVSGQDRSVRVLGISAPETLNGAGGEKSVTAAALDSGGSLAATGSKDGKVRVWVLPAATPIATIDMGGAVTALAFGPDRRTLAVAIPGAIRLIQASSGEEVRRLGGQAGTRTMAFSGNGCCLAAAGPQRAQVWNLASPNSPAIFWSDGISALTFSYRGNQLLTAREGRIQLWDVRAEKRSNDVGLGQDERITALALSPDASYLAAATRDGSIRILQSRGGAPIAQLTGHRAIAALTFSSDSKFVISAEYGEEIVIERRLWRTSDLIGEACARLTRNLNAREVFDYLRDVGYTRACENLPDDMTLSLLYPSVVNRSAARAK